MGCGSSGFADVPLRPPKPGPSSSDGNIKSTFVSASELYCISQHVSEWPEYYSLIDTRSISAYEKSHINNAQHVSDIDDDLSNKVGETTVVIYDNKSTSPNIASLLSKISDSKTSVTNVYVLQDPFSFFKRRYRVLLSNFFKTEGEQPGPIELIPATKMNPAIYSVHRNQFQHCKTTIAYLGCSTVINISSRRLFLKTATIRLENIQFDSVSEPYDEAISAFMRYAKEKPSKAVKGNILLIDETGADYAALLAGWYLVQNGFNLEVVCENLSLKMGELDPWYLDVLRAWSESGE